jgi:aspartate/methionine/tyrosine aminotransferase
MPTEDADMQLVRNHEDPKAFNLAVGEPFFLHEHLHVLTSASPTGGPYLYPQTRGEPELLKELDRRHHGMHVVVTNGAKQALCAALWAYANVYGRDYATHAAPYWPSYPFLAGKELKHGLNPLNITGAYKGQVRIVTSPNNPNGVESTDDCDIWDAAYASPVYGFTTPPAHWTVAVYSAAKMLGLSGLRVGWAVTSDSRLAAAMSKYVERFTSGVCVTSQRHVAYALKHLRIHDDHAFFDNAREALLENGSAFMKAIGDRMDEVHGVPVTGKGMFAWFKPNAQLADSFISACQTANVQLVGGNACGMLDEGWYRMSMGHHTSHTYRALKALSGAWK